jgi:hypothetical protein
MPHVRPFDRLSPAVSRCRDGRARRIRVPAVRAAGLLDRRSSVLLGSCRKTLESRRNLLIYSLLRFVTLFGRMGRGGL